MDYITASKMLLTMNKHQHVDLYLVSNMRSLIKRVQVSELLKSDQQIRLAILIPGREAGSSRRPSWTPKA